MKQQITLLLVFLILSVQSAPAEEEVLALKGYYDFSK